MVCAVCSFVFVQRTESAAVIAVQPSMSGCVRSESCLVSLLPDFQHQLFVVSQLFQFIPEGREDYAHDPVMQWAASSARQEALVRFPLPGNHTCSIVPHSSG